MIQTIEERIALHAQTQPDKAAVIFETESVAYGTLWTRALQCAAFFRGRGVQNGDRIVVQGKYTVWFAISAFAAHLSGAVFIPTDKKPPAEAITALAERVDAALIVSDIAAPGKDCVPFSDLAAACDTFPADPDAFGFPQPDAPADIMFTTGTTGTPKGVVLTHENLAVTALTRISECALKPDNVGATLVPMNHVAPMRELYLNAYNGSSFIFLDGMARIGMLFKMLRTHGITSMYVPPAGITLIEQMAKDQLGQFADQIDYVYTGSAPMQASQQEYMRRMLPKSRLYFSYGSSENGTVCLLRYDRDLKDLSCCGKPCAGVEVAILDDSFRPLPTGEVGRIGIRSKMNLQGYYMQPELTASVFHDGFFLSNDVGKIDEDGFLYVSGRMDDLINIGGLKVYPSEIETAALTISGVQDCVCFAIDDPKTGQAPKLLIRLCDGAALTISEIHDALSNLMDAYKVPREIGFVDEIARTSNGKTDRKFYQSNK